VTTSGGLNVVTGIVFKGFLKGCHTGGQADNPFEAVDVHQYLGWIRSTTGIGLNDNAEFYATDGAGGITPLRTHAWDRTWDLIVPGQFNGDGRTDLLFYDREGGGPVRRDGRRGRHRGPAAARVGQDLAPDRRSEYRRGYLDGPPLL
jgi:hypothetical protein